jgi:hypothetical protein
MTYDTLLKSMIRIEYFQAAMAKPESVAPRMLSPFPAHSDSTRFKGTRLKLTNREIKEPIMVQVLKSMNNGDNVVVAWYDIRGNKYTKILDGNDNVEILALRDNSIQSQIMAMPHQERREKRQTPIQRIFLELKRKKVESSIKGNTITFMFGAYTITAEDEHADLSSKRAGHIRSFPLTEKGIIALAMRAKKIDDRFDPTKVPV